MSRSQRAGEGPGPSGVPPASSSRYHRSSIRSQKGPGLGSSSTRVQVVAERGYDSEIPRELGGMASVSAGYHTEGQASTTTKRASKELLRNVVDPRRNGRLSSMPSQHPTHSYNYDYPIHHLDDTDQSSTRRVRKNNGEKSRHRDREQRDPVDPVPPSVWINQLNAADAKRARRTSGSRTRHEEPQQFQHDPRAYPPGSFPPNQDHHRHPHYQSPPYGYAHHQSNPHRNGNPAPTHIYRPDDPAPDLPGAPQATNPRYDFVIDDRAGMHSPPPVEIPHPMQSPPPVPLATPAAPLLPLPRSKEELLRSEGLPPQGSPLTGHRRHRPGRSEDFANGAFADATNHARTSLRHRPSHSEDLRKLGQGLPVAEPEEHITHQLARPFHVGRSASENVVPQIPATQPQLATPGMYSTGLAVTPAATRGFAMTPQLQESFAESANASRAPVNAAMASAAIANGTDSDSTRGEKERKRRTRRSRQVDAPTEGVSAADLQALQLAKEPTPPPTVQPIRRQRTVSGRSITAQPTPPPPPAIPAEMDREEDMVVYQRPPDPATVDSARAPQPITSPPVQARVDMFRMPGEPLPQGLAMFASRPEMTSSGITPAGTRTDMTQVPGPRADMTHEISRGVETLRAAGEVAPVPVPLPAARRGSILDEERTRKYSAATEGGASASGTGSRRPSGANEGQGRPVVRPEDQPHRRPSPNYAIATATRKSVASDASGDSFQSAQLGGSTTLDFQSARDAMSMAMSPMSNYHSIAPSVRSEVRDPRVMVAANEARNQDSIVQPGSKMTTGPTTTGYRPVEKRASGIVPIGHVPVPGVAFPGAHANPISPPPALANVISPSISKERVLRAAPVPATPMTVPKSVEPEVPTRPRVPSNDMLGSTPPDVPVLRATVDAHVPAPSVPVDEEGRLRGPPPVVSTMPNRPARMSLTRPPPQQTATPATSPPQTHAQTQPEASAVPKNLQQTQQVEGSKESLPETLASTKQSKSKSSKWWKSSSSAPKAPSPTPTPAPPGTSQPRQRLFSGFLPGSSKHKAQKPSESTPAPPSQPRPSGDEMYNFYESTPSSTTLEHEPEPREKESRMQRMVTAIRGGLRRTPSTSKIGGHFPSKSMSRLPGTTSTAMAGAPLARSASTNANGRDGAMFPMSPSRSKDPPLRPVAPPAAPPTVPEPPVVPPLVPAPVPNSAPTPAPAPAMTVPISVVASSAAVPPTPKPRPAEAAPEKRPAKEKDVPIIDKTRVPISSGPPTASTAPRVTRTYIGVDGRPVDPTSRAEKRSSTQAPPPAHPQRPNSPPLVNRPVAPGRVPVGPTKIFTNDPQRTAAYPAPGPAPVPNTPHTSHRTLSRSGPRITSQRDRVPSNPAAPSNQLRPSRSREQSVYPADPPPPPANATPGNADLGLPTPDATPRASPTGEDIFEGRADALREERERERERRQSDGRRHRPGRIVIPPSEYANYPVPSMDDVNQRLQAGADPNSHGGLLKFGHREKRAVSVASMEAVSGQEGHFRSETSSIRTSTPGPHQITFPNRDPAEATQSWAKHQTEEDIRAGTGRKSGRESRKRSGVLKHSSRTGVRKPGVAFDFPSGPIIEADEDPQESRQQADIHLTYELERRHKRYK